MLANIYYIVGIISCIIGLIVLGLKIYRAYYMWRRDTSENVIRTENMIDNGFISVPWYKRYGRNARTFFKWAHSGDGINRQKQQ